MRQGKTNSQYSCLGLSENSVQRAFSAFPVPSDTMCDSLAPSVPMCQMAFAEKLPMMFQHLY
jgi:hypothetical protein